MVTSRLALALLKGLWIWGFASWVYAVAIQLDPVTTKSQYGSLSAYIPIPVDVFGILGFVVSFVAFVLWEWKRHVPSSQ